MVETEAEVTRSEARVCIPINLKPEQHRRIKALAAREDIPISILIRRAMLRMLEEEGV